jgi:peptide/nickel transport system substrate-binding protein
LVGAAFVSCAQPDPQQPRRQNTLRLGIRDTIEARAVFTPILFAERLIAIDWHGRPQPVLATDWVWQDDGRALTVHLRHDVTFHDGTPFTGPVVVDILRYSQAHDRRRAFASVVGFKAVDDYTIEITLREPDVFLVEALADTWMVDVRKPDIGTGPFKLLTRVPSITAERYNKYYRGTPGMERVEVITYETPRAAWVASMREEIDMVQEVNRDSAEFLEGASHVEISSVTRPFYIPLVFNLRHPVLRKVEVRRALAEAINRDEIVQQALGGHGRVADDPVWPFNWAYNAAARTYGYNPNAARLRLDSAGFPVRRAVAGRMASRFSIRCLFWNDPQYERMALLLQRQLADVGVDLILEASNEDQLQAHAGNGTFDTFLYQLTSGKSFNWTYRFWHSPTVGAAYQDSGYTGVDSVLERLRRVRRDSEIRTALADLRERFYRDVPAVFLAWPETARAIDTGFDIGDRSDPDVFANLWKWRPAERQVAAR